MAQPNKLVCWLRSFLFIVVFASTTNVFAAEIEQVISGSKVQTLAGLLRTEQTIFKDQSWINRAFLNNKVIFEDQSGENLIGIQAKYPLDKPARLILLSLSDVASGCPVPHLRVLEIEQDGSHRLSEEFGNCLPPADPKWFKMLKENPVYQNGEWRIALPIPSDGGVEAAAVRTTFEWYIYRDGKITRH